MMNRQKIAQELVAVARDLTAADYIREMDKALASISSALYRVNSTRDSSQHATIARDGIRRLFVAQKVWEKVKKSI